VYHIKAERNEADYVLLVNSPLNISHILFSLVVGIVVALVFLLLGFVVYIKKADDKRTIVFSLMAISAAAYFILDAVTLIDAKNALGIFSESGVTLGGAAIESFVLIVEFLPILFLLHLALIFPRERPMIRIRPEIVRWMYWFPLLLIPTPKLFLNLPTIPTQVAKIVQPVALFVFQPLLIFMIVLYPVATCVALLRSYSQSNVEEKQQVKWPLWGSIIAVSGFFGVPFAIAALQGMTGERISYWMLDEILPKLFFLLIPISFSFAIKFVNR